MQGASFLSLEKLKIGDPIRTAAIPKPESEISRNALGRRPTLVSLSQDAPAERPASLVHDALESPIGDLLVVGDDHALRGLYMRGGRQPDAILSGLPRSPAPFAGVRRQLGEYFAGERTGFELTLEMGGTPFQRRVWDALREIPYGETIDYGELARRIGSPSAARAVGLANARNPISVIVPCHRVIGANGDLTGYGGGIERKRMLLDLERAQTRLSW
jgi:methylated-DNA-[protein]-cysteine S-methyltransferase